MRFNWSGATSYGYHDRGAVYRRTQLCPLARPCRGHHWAGPELVGRTNATTKTPDRWPYAIVGEPATSGASATTLLFRHGQCAAHPGQGPGGYGVGRTKACIAVTST